MSEVEKINHIAYYSDNFELDPGLETDRKQIIMQLIEESQNDRRAYKENLNNAEMDLYGTGTGNQLK